MTQAIFGLIGVVVGAALTSGLDWLHARAIDRRMLRTAARAAVEALQRTASVAEVALGSDLVGPKFHAELESLSLDEPIAQIRAFGTFEQWAAIATARRQLAFVLLMGQSESLSSDHRDLLAQLQQVADDAATQLERLTD